MAAYILPVPQPEYWPLIPPPPEYLTVTPHAKSPVAPPEYSPIKRTANSAVTVRSTNYSMGTTPENSPVVPPENSLATPPENSPATPPENAPVTMIIPIYAIVLMAVASLIIIVIMALCFYCIWKRRNVDPHFNTGDAEAGRRQESEPNNKQSLQVTTTPLVYTEARRHEEVCSGNAAPPNGDAHQAPSPYGIQKLASVNLKSYKYQDLAHFTGSFSRSNLLGRGGFGEVYKGTLADGGIAAIKKLTHQAGQKEEEFVAEISTVNRVHHKYLVKLLGYCCDDQSNRLLVYEYVPNNSLSSHLHGNDKPILSWYNRLKIAIGSAKGLEYLHQYCNPKIIHRDIKADNILLDDNFEPKIADFGLARDFSYSVTHISTDPKGTFGYLAPEYAKDRKLTDRSDVFSFGVVLLELITGKKSVFFEGNEAYNLAACVMPHIEKALESGNYDELVDPKLEKKDIDENELARMTSCAAACVYKPARDRPHMSQIVEALQGKISLDNIWINNDSKFFYDFSGKRRELYSISEFSQYEGETLPSEF